METITGAVALEISKSNAMAPFSRLKYKNSASLSAENENFLPKGRTTPMTSWMSFKTFKIYAVFIASNRWVPVRFPWIFR